MSTVTVPVRMSIVERVLMCLVAVALTLASLAHKLSCTTGIIDPADPGYLARVTRTACYSDVAGLFGARDLAAHVFPYVHGSYTANPPAVHGGTVEYPTLTGIWVWFSALPVTSAHGFLVVTAITFVPVIVLATLALQRLGGRRAWLWAATPPLVLYALYNWDVIPVLLTALGLVVALAGPRRWSPTTRALLAGAAFGIGGAFKLYPLLFVLPLALSYVLDRGRTARWRCAIGAVGAAVVAVAAANVPFALVNEPGWSSVFRFQAARPISGGSLSIWYWGLLPWSASGDPTWQHRMAVAATLSTAVGLVVAVVIGVVVARRTGTMPWVQTAGAMLAVYMLCNKVDSLQYTLWLLPFLVVLRVRPGWIVAFLLADLAEFVGWYRTLYYHALGNLQPTWADQMLSVGVFGRAVLLVVLCAVFLRSPLAESPVAAGRVDRSAAAPDAYASMGG